MSQVTVDVVTHTNKSLGPLVIPLTNWGPTSHGIYTGLESLHSTEGLLTDKAGRCRGRAGMRVLDAGDYKFLLTGKPKPTGKMARKDRTITTRMRRYCTVS